MFHIAGQVVIAAMACKEWCCRQTQINKLSTVSPSLGKAPHSSFHAVALEVIARTEVQSVRAELNWAEAAPVLVLNHTLQSAGQTLLGNPLLSSCS